MFGLSHIMASAPHVSRVKKTFCMCRDLYIYAPSSKHTPMISHVIGKRKCSAFSYVISEQCPPSSAIPTAYKNLLDQLQTAQYILDIF
jgi:hypothetical protein